MAAARTSGFLSSVPVSRSSLGGRARVLPHAVALALAGIAVASLAPVHVAHAQQSSAAVAHSFDVPPGPLDQALSRLGRQAGVQLVVNADTTAGLHSRGVSGSHTVAEALRRVLAGTGLEAVRDAAGNYSLRSAPVAVPHAGGVTALAAVTVSGKAPGAATEGTGSYTTSSSSSSTRLNLAPRETPQSLTVITRQQLDDMKATSLDMVIEATPGIHVSRQGIGSDIYGYYARGFEIRNFEVDGVPTDNGLNLFNQNAVIYDRVEIVRGATGLISGMGNPAATINLIRKRPTLDPQTSIGLDAGNWGRRGVTLDTSQPLNESGSVRGRLVADYRQQEGWLDRFEQKQGTLYGIAEVDVTDDTLVTLGFTHSRVNADSPQRGGTPSFYPDGTRTNLPRTLNYAPDWSYNDQQTDGVFASVEHAWASGWIGKAEYSYTQTDYDFMFAFMRGTLQSDGSGVRLLPARWTGKPRQHNLDLYLTGSFPLFGREHELIGGVTLSDYTTSGPSYGAYLNDYANSPRGLIEDIFSYDGRAETPVFQVASHASTEIRNRSAYVSSRLHLTDDLKLILGSRYVRWDRNIRSWGGAAGASAQQSEENVLVPYVGAVYDLDRQWAVYASATKIFSPQGQWVRDADNNLVDPLEGTGLELGIKGSHFDERLNSSIALFHTKQDNLAVWTATTGAYAVEQDTTSRGVELELNGELARNWQLAAGFTHTRTTDAQGRSINSFLPRNTFKLYTRYRLPGDWQALTVGGGLRWQSKTGAEGVWQSGQTIASLMARYEVTPSTTVSLNVDNLFDRRYYSGIGAASTYAAPRSVVVGLTHVF